MKLREIYIRDFGIFNNQKLANLSAELIIIGGKNRAGKSSFADILKYLPYGLPQDSSIPPAENKYYIEAGAEGDNQNYQIIVNGFAAAEAVSENGKSKPALELYNNLDQMTYQQLFSLDLGKLQQISQLGKNKKEEKRIYSILLGAGLSELIKLPEIAEKYNKKAKNIGGSLGNPAVASFKPLNKELKRAEKKRDQALKEVDHFIAEKEKLQRKKKDLENINKKIAFLTKKEFIFDLLKNNYQKLDKINKLEFKVNKKEKVTELDFKKGDIEELENYLQRLKECQQEVAKEKELILREIKEDKLTLFLNHISAAEKKLLNFEKQKEILKEKLKNIEKTEAECSSSLQDLKLELEDLNISWEEPFKQLEGLNIDLIKQQELIVELKEFRELKAEIKELEKSLAELNLEFKNKKKQIKDNNLLSANKVLKKSILFITSSSLLSSYFLYQSLYPLLFISTSFLITALIYFLAHYKSSKLKEAEKLELEREIDSLQQKIDFQNKSIKENKAALTLKEQQLKKYAQILTIEEQDYLKILAEYFRELKDKKRRYKKIRLKMEELRQKKEEVNLKLKEITCLSQKLKPLLKDDFLFEDKSKDLLKSRKKDLWKLETENPFKNKADLLKNEAKIFKDFERIYSLYLQAKKYLELVNKSEKLKAEIEANLELSAENSDLKRSLKNTLESLKEAAELKELKDELTAEKSQINYSLQSSAKSREYLSSLTEAELKGKEIKKTKRKEKNEDLKPVEKFKKLYSSFSSADSLLKEYKGVEKRLAAKVNKKEKIKSEITTLNNSIQELASSEKIEEAQQEIGAAKNDLEKLAQKYAVNKSVYFILNKLRAKMIKKAEDELLKPAAEIFSEITAGQYQKIEPAEKLENIEFKTTTKNGKKYKSADSLSQATLEQLFLSLRFSRIKEIRPALPLILDDAFVNFDYSHLYHTLKIITKLAADNQIFILSCHPHLVKAAAQITDSAQYWKLEGGNFKLTKPEKLAAYLKT